MYTTILDKLLWSSEFLSPFGVIIDSQNDKRSESAFQIQQYIKKRPKIYYLFHVAFGF